MRHIIHLAQSIRHQVIIEGVGSLEWIGVVASVHSKTSWQCAWQEHYNDEERITNLITQLGEKVNQVTQEEEDFNSNKEKDNDQ